MQTKNFVSPVGEVGYASCYFRSRAYMLPYGECMMSGCDEKGWALEGTE